MQTVGPTEFGVVESPNYVKMGHLSPQGDGGTGGAEGAVTPRILAGADLHLFRVVSPVLDAGHGHGDGMLHFFKSLRVLLRRLMERHWLRQVIFTSVVGLKGNGILKAGVFLTGIRLLFISFLSTIIDT